MVPDRGPPCPDALRLVLRVDPRLSPAPADPERVPREGTVDQFVGYLAAAVTTVGAEPLIGLHLTATGPEGFHALAGEPRTRLRATVGH